MIAQIKTLRSQIPDGPWGWFGYASRGHAYLATQWGGHKIVMDTHTSRRAGKKKSVSPTSSIRFQQFTPPDLIRGTGWGCGTLQPVWSYATLDHNTAIVDVQHPIATAFQLLPEIMDAAIATDTALTTAKVIISQALQLIGHAAYGAWDNGNKGAMGTDEGDYMAGRLITELEAMAREIGMGDDQLGIPAERWAALQAEAVRAADAGHPLDVMCIGDEGECYLSLGHHHPQEFLDAARTAWPDEAGDGELADAKAAQVVMGWVTEHQTPDGPAFKKADRRDEGAMPVTAVGWSGLQLVDFHPLTIQAHPGGIFLSEGRHRPAAFLRAARMWAFGTNSLATRTVIDVVNGWALRRTTPGDDGLMYEACLQVEDKAIPITAIGWTDLAELGVFA